MREAIHSFISNIVATGAVGKATMDRDRLCITLEDLCDHLRIPGTKNSSSPVILSWWVEHEDRLWLVVASQKLPILEYMLPRNGVMQMSSRNHGRLPIKRAQRFSPIKRLPSGAAYAVDGILAIPMGMKKDN